MRVYGCVLILACAVLAACQDAQPATATIAAGDRLLQIRAGSRTPQALLKAAGVVLAEGDHVRNNGYEVDPAQALPISESLHLQVAPRVPVFINGEISMTAAETVGEALEAAGIVLYRSDILNPPADALIVPALVITLEPAGVLAVRIDGTARQVRSAAASIGAALAESGSPILGLDTASIHDQDAQPKDGDVRLSRISETVLLSQESIPYDSVSSESSDVELGLEQVLDPGTPGLAVTKTIIHSEDGVETERQIGSRVVIRPPQDRVVVRGTKVVEQTISIDGVAITFWRSLQMYATVYSPCNSGTSDGSCSYGTASGRRAGKGVVAVDPGLYAYLNGQQLYIPGYGFAVVGDVGGGRIVESSLGISRYRWIDLGFDDSNLQDMSGWTTVYFLSPAPATIPEVLR